MAGNTATLTVRIVSDARSAAQGFDQAESRVGKFSRGMDKAAVAAGGVLAGMAALGKSAFDAASAMQQSSGAVESIFGDQSKAVKKLAKDAARANGLSANSYQELASVLGAQLKNMGVSMDKLAPKTDELIDLGSDLAATFGGTTADAVSALSSLLKGERDPIERYGVAIKQADLDARLAAMGLNGLEGEAKKAAETQALFALVLEQTSSAAGAHNREMDTAAGSTAIAAAAWEDAKASLGESLLPVVTDIATKVKDLTDWMTNNKDTVETWTPVLAGAAVGIIAISAAAKAAAAAQILWNLAIAANPLVAIVLAIIAVIIIIGVLYYKFQGFRDFVNGALQFAFMPFFTIGRTIGDLIDDLKNAENAFDVLKAVATAALKLILNPLISIVDRFKQVAGWFKSGASWVGDLFGAPAEPASAGGGQQAGMFGAAGGEGAWAPIRGASMSSPSGGPSPSAGRGPAGTVVNVTINGALDPVAVGRQLDGILRKYATATGRQVSARMNR